jgi:hypothetical protein
MQTNANDTNRSDSYASTAAEGVKHLPDTTRVNGVLKDLVNRAPKTPTEAFLGNLPKAERYPWSFDYVDGRYVVYLPRNIDREGFNPSAETTAAAAAVLALQAEIDWAGDMPDSSQHKELTSKDVSNFYFGIVRALSHKTIESYVPYSGSFGRGYTTIIHWIAERQFGRSDHIKGRPGNIMGYFASYEAKAVDSQIRRNIIALIKEASKTIAFSDRDGTWLRQLEDLKGGILKKDLMVDQEGLLLKEELDYIKSQFSSGYEKYKVFTQSIQDKEPSLLKSLFDDYAYVRRAVQQPEELLERVVSERANAVYSGTVKGKKAKKQPLKNLVAKMGTNDFISTFNPCRVLNIRAYNMPLIRSDYSSSEYTHALNESFEKYVSSNTRSGSNESELLNKWWYKYVVPRLELD